MTGSMYAAISGLKSHMNALSVIGNNISNVNTLGYKTTRYTFNEALYTTQRTGSDGTASLGGVNPAQIGFGASLGTIDLDMSTKNYTLTGRNLDTMIDGDGFFLVGDKIVGDLINGKSGVDFDGAPGEIELLKTLKLTRLGNFNIDANGYLVDGNGSVVWGFLETKVNSGYTEDGNYLDAYDTVETRNSIAWVNKILYDPATNRLTPPAEETTEAKEAREKEIEEARAYEKKWHNVIQNPDGMITSATTTDGETLTSMRLPMVGEWTATIERTDYVLDSNNEPVPSGKTTTTEKGSSIVWPEEEETAHAVKDRDKSGALLFDGTTLISSGSPDSATKSTDTVYYDTTGKALVDNNGKPLSFDQITDKTTIKYSIATTYDYPEVYSRLQPDSVSINDKTGALTVLTSDQHLITIGYLAIGKVTNPNGVTHVDGRYYQAQDGAGELRVTTIGGAVDGVESAGDTALITGGLESSGTDLATEITNMITVQRGYQANTRIVTVTDSMLEELVNMKR